MYRMDVPPEPPIYIPFESDREAKKACSLLVENTNLNITTLYRIRPEEVRQVIMSFEEKPNTTAKAKS